MSPSDDRTRPISRPEVLPYGDRALLLELGDTARVVSWADALRADPPPGLGEVVAGGASLLVVAARDTRLADLRAALAEVPEPDDGGRLPADGPAVEIPVRYDGPDLADVARLTALTEQEVVAAHTGQTWRVAFGGFAPGFGYLLGDDDRLRVPRREASRTEVPRGAVGLADSYAGVYPRRSPGGWQLIGSTDAVMWDIERDPPALLTPGASVRFVRVDAAEGS